MDYSEHNLPEDNICIMTSIGDINAFILEIEKYNRNSTLTNEQKRTRTLAVRQQIMRTYA